VLRSVFEAPAFVACFYDFAVMREAIEKRGRHLCIPKDAWPFAEGQVCCDDDRGTFVELADQVEQELAPGLGEGQIAQFIKE